MYYTTLCAPSLYHTVLVCIIHHMYIHYTLYIVGGGLRKGMLAKMKQVLADRLPLYQNITTTTPPSPDSTGHNSDPSSPVPPPPLITTGKIKRRRFPIILTSSEYKMGGAALWSLMLDAFAGENLDNLYYGIEELVEEEEGEQISYSGEGQNYDEDEDEDIVGNDGDDAEEGEEE